MNWLYVLTIDGQSICTCRLAFLSNRWMLVIGSIAAYRLSRVTPRLSNHLTARRSTPSIMTVCKTIAPRPFFLRTLSSGSLQPRRRLARTVPTQAIHCFHRATCKSVPVNQLSKYTLCQIILGMLTSSRSTMFADGFRSGCPGQGSIFPV